MSVQTGESCVTKDNVFWLLSAENDPESSVHITGKHHAAMTEIQLENSLSSARMIIPWSNSMRHAHYAPP